MLFNSFEFAIFLPIVFALYWVIPAEKTRLQNLLLLAASYLFYGWWDWRYLSLILISTIVDYLVGRGLGRADSARVRRLLLWTSVVVNLGMLGVFKYYNFFMSSLVSAFGTLGIVLRPESLRVLLPVGISFYTFQTLSYTIDVYGRRLEPETDAIAFATFVAFFPQLVAGPIERARNLLPQFKTARSFDYAKAVDGVRQILWGLFKKVVVADSCARFADLFFSNPEAYAGSALFLGMIFFAFQIYGDFSGYSDMAIGIARLFGFGLMRNFATPYFARDIAEFWRRWHISLSTWFRDYLYIPLGGSRGGTARKIRNTLLIFAISGLWHGANWTFLIWGVLNGLYFIPLLLRGKNRRYLSVVAENRSFPSLAETGGMALTFGLTLIAWVFFRSATVQEAGVYLSELFSWSLFSVPEFPGRRSAATTLCLIGVLLFVEWIGRNHEYGLQWVGLRWKGVSRAAVYYALVGAILWFGSAEQQFIYFQF